MTNNERKKILKRHGFICGERDRRLNTNYPGRFMVTQADYASGDYELPTKDGANGPWCIVGDDLPQLIAQAVEAAPW